MNCITFSVSLQDAFADCALGFSPGANSLLPVLIVFLPPDGLERATLAQFIGRFHLLTVHFPLPSSSSYLYWSGREESRRFP